MRVVQGPMTHVLIPGAWHGGWVWQPVAERLRGAGHRALPITLPGTGFQDDRAGFSQEDATRHVVDEITRRDMTEVVLVAHSLGGITLSAVAARLRERVIKLIFLSAFVPEPSTSMNDANDTETAAFVRAMIAGSPDGTVSLPFEAFCNALMQGEPESAQRIVHNLLTPSPGRYFLDPYDGPDPAASGIPTRYLLAKDDRGLARPGTELAARLGVEAEIVPGTHEALLTHPDEVAGALLAR